MKKNKYSLALIISLFLLPILSLTVFANSSWRWISETRPYDVLPWVAIATLIIETISITYFAKAEKKFLTFIVVTLANLLSFAAPYLFAWNAQPSLGGYPFEMALEHTPFYTIGVAYYMITILIELPIVFISIPNTVSNKKFAAIILISNAVTTALTAIVERIICVGRW